MLQPKMGLLPLYLELYDKVMPEIRTKMEEFRDRISLEFTRRGLAVTVAPVCRVESEFMAAMGLFENASVDAIVTLHLAYSPSLEAVSVLANTRLPLIVLDTTPSFSFAPGDEPTELMYNHGIHGVQDLCNRLIRAGKTFHIEAGHWQKSDVLDRVVGWVKAAAASTNLSRARVGLIGSQFKGMGDFAVPFEVLKSTLGVEVVVADFAELVNFMPGADAPETLDEVRSDQISFNFNAQDDFLEEHKATSRVGLAVRRWIEKHELTAFTMNFSDINATTGLPTVPFLEASKAMARGIGYAGEGDVLTAAFVGVLASLFPETSFTEMFCPDWEHNAIFLSHMGEINPRCVSGKPVLAKKSLPWINTGDPVMIVGRFKAGLATLVNLAPMPDDDYSLILVPVKVIGPEDGDGMTDTVRGWITSEVPLADLLAEYSNLGGTHHSALVYGDALDTLIRLGMIRGWETAVIG
jgi:L-arabinose isomerase